MMTMAGLFLLTIFITVQLLAPAVTRSVITVDKVPVEQGKSIIIPCLYNAEYINNQKYLCFGDLWTLCVKQNKNRKVSISYDHTQPVFTVTMKNVTTGDAGLYWCSVENSDFDIKKPFQLKVTKAPLLYVDDQMVTGYEGSHVVVSCQTSKPNMVYKWCKLGGACVHRAGNISGASVQLSRMDKGFRVTLSELTMDNTGWYWCSAGDEQMPVHLTVLSVPPKWERSSFAWLVFLGFLLTLAFMAGIVFRQHKQHCKILPQRSENTYMSMKKPKQQQHEASEAQDYEYMCSPVQSHEVKKNPQDNESPKISGGLKGSSCTC